MSALDPALADVDWAARFMPVCRAIAHDVDITQTLTGTELTIDLPSGPCALHLAQLLQGAGAHVAYMASACAPAHTATANAMALPLTVAASGIVIGSDAKVTHDARGAIVDVAASPLKRYVEQTIGIGQAAVMALVDITNLQLAGRCIVVAGYCEAGRSVASHAKALGGVVTVIAHDPVSRVRAVCDGFFASADEDLSEAEVIFCVEPSAMDRAVMAADTLRPGVILCNATDRLTHGIGAGESLRQHVTRHVLKGGRDMRVIAGGQPVHHAAGQGLPLQVQDAVLALHIGAVVQMLNAPPAGTTPLDPIWDQRIAREMLHRRE